MTSTRPLYGHFTSRMEDQVVSHLPHTPQVLDQYESSVEEMVDGEAYEQSEMVLYKASVLAEGGKAQQALEVLERNLVSRGGHTIGDLWARCDGRARTYSRTPH